MCHCVRVTQVDQLAELYVARAMELDPLWATLAGVAGYDDQMADTSPEGFQARAELDRRTIAALSAVTATSEPERIARAAMLERLGLAVEQYDAGEVTSDVNVIASWMHSVRQVFDLMPVDGEEAQRDLAVRMAAVPQAYAGLRRTYLQAAQRGRVAARRQVEGCARQCADWSAADGAFYLGLVDRTDATGTLRRQLDQAAQAATAATAEFGRFLRTELLPLAPERDAVGRDRYLLASRSALGAVVDLDEAYAWGWAEIRRLEAELAQVAGQIVGGGTVDEAVAALKADPARRITGRENIRSWMQDHADATIAELHGTHFDIPEPARRIECQIAPTSQGGAYYRGPSEDWSRPGQLWWSPAGGVAEFATWLDTSTIHHEGVPGHHLQLAELTFRTDRLNRWQRTMAFVTGHCEGWALYAQRLMDELGYLDDPGDRLGLLDQQLLHAAEVVIDIGVHLERPVPPGTGWRDGEIWNADLAWEFLRSHSHYSDANLRFALDRYLGTAGQVPSYKLGERSWLQAREAARQRQGASFDLKKFHSQALALGSLGLDPLREALAGL
jgi:uncharacterized protein (DUF885 family)